MKADIENTVTTLLEASLDKLKTYFSFEGAPEIEIDVPRESSFGDLTSNIAMKLGRQTRRPAREIAHIMADHMNTLIKEAPHNEIIKRIEVRGAGFINFFVKGDSLYTILNDIRKDGKRFGRCSLGKGTKLNIEFASANPTGPLTIAHGRQAAFGDSLANILEFTGFRVKREYYINDEGRQINLLGSSIRARYLEFLGESVEFPADGYHGDYVEDVAADIKDIYGTRKRNADEKFFADYGYKSILGGIKKDLKDFGVKFDIWFSQRRLSSSNKIEKALAILEKNDLVYEKDGAVWLRSTRYGDEKDRVIKRSNKLYTYFGPDIAYHLDKYKRGFNKLIDIWGPDHHGYIPRMKAAVSGLGYDKESLSTLIVQLVTLYRGKEPIPMSTRAGSFITLEEVVREIGRDAARYFFLRRRKESHLDFDLELAKKHSLDNPVYYIQYAHARICSILGFDKKNQGLKSAKADLSLLKSQEEFRMLRLLRQFPLVVHAAAGAYEPYRLLNYLEELAKSFHSFYNKHRVVSDNAAVTKARLILVECVKIVLANGLRLIGVSAPASM